MEDIIRKAGQNGKYGVFFWEEQNTEEPIRFYCGLLNYNLYNKDPERALESMHYIASDSFENAVKEITVDIKVKSIIKENK